MHLILWSGVVASTVGAIFGLFIFSFLYEVISPDIASYISFSIWFVISLVMFLPVRNIIKNWY